MPPTPVPANPGPLNSTPPTPAPKRRWAALLAVVLAVVLLHAWLTSEVASHMQEASQSNVPRIQRMEATYVSELKLSAPPVAAAPVAPPAKAAPAKARRRPAPAKAASAPPEPAAPVAEAASAPAEAVASGPAPALAQAQASSPTPPEVASSLASAAAASKAAANAVKGATPGSGPAFVWPKATRVTYKLEGFFRGPIYGQATVEWLRTGKRYQVHVDATVGPNFAPLGSWNLTSEGEITPEGLSPKRYENVNRLLIRSSAPKVVGFEDDVVVMPDGGRVPRMPGMQDPASQFIQLAYRFIVNPSLLKVGNTIEMPMVTLKKVDVLAYDVLAEELLQTPLGPLPTFHVKPRLMSAANGLLPAEIWFAPGLQYLPVRILVRLDDKTHMDMQMDKAPQQVPGGDGPDGDYTGP